MFSKYWKLEKDGFHLNYTNDSSCLLLSFYRNAMRAKASCLLGETSEFWGGYPWNKEKGTYKCVPLQRPLFSSLTYTAVICYNTETTTFDLDPVDVSHHRLLGSFCHPSVLDPISIRVSVWTSEPPSSHFSPFLSTPTSPFPQSTCFMQTGTLLLCSHLYPQDRG